MTTETKRPSDIARAILESVTEDRLVLHLPHTDYHVQLVRTDEGGEIGVPIGKRIKGRIEGRAMRIHAASGGGTFIEPVMGEPRIITGRVLSVDEPNKRVLVDVAVPMWLETEEGQDYDEIEEGNLVTCYVHSGARFTPVEG